MIDRRSFVKLAAGAALGGVWGAERALRAEAASQGRSLGKIGVQLYSVRGLMETDFAGTLEAVAAAGYDQVEFAGYYGHAADDVRSILDHVGLEAPAAHVGIDFLRSDLATVLDTARTVGHRYVIAPWLPPEARGSIAGYRELARFLNETGAACREAGLAFGWHNHDFELASVDGEVPLDVLLGETDPALVDFEMDLYWIVKGGGDPLAYFTAHPGRFKLCHVKDMTADGEMVDVGAGSLDFGAIFAQSKQAGLEFYFVEHDEPADPLASIRASHDYLRALTF
jgi:sugar phosphate isomerase/epimerase